jgi:hypothetical protein
MTARSMTYGFSNEQQYGETLAQVYDDVMMSGAMSMIGNKFMRGNAPILKTMWGNAFKIMTTRDGDDNLIQNSAKNLFNKGLTLYWTGAVFTPAPPAIPVNVVTSPGNPDVLVFGNTNDPSYFINILINNIKLYMLTIVGTGWVGII